MLPNYSLWCLRVRAWSQVSLHAQRSVTAPGDIGIPRRREANVGRNDGSRGYTLVELSVVVALASVLLAVTISGAMRLLLSARVTAMSDMCQQAVMAVNSVYKSSATYAGLTTRQLVAFGPFPGNMITNPASDAVVVSHALGGTLSAHSINSDLPGQPIAWGLYLDQIPVEACGELLITLDPLSDAIALMPSGNGGTFQNNISFSTMANSFTSSGLPVTYIKNIGSPWSPAMAGAACNAAGSSVAIVSLGAKVQ